MKLLSKQEGGVGSKKLHQHKDSTHTSKRVGGEIDKTWG